MPIPQTPRETYGRWTFLYYLVAKERPGMPFAAQVEVYLDDKQMRVFMLSQGDTVEAMQAALRHHCEEYVKDVEDPGRVERRNTRTIGDRIKRGQAGEKGVR
jgi:hypothetical protein